MNLKKNGKVFTSKFVGTGPLSYEKRIYRAVVSQRLRNTGVDHVMNPNLHVATESRGLVPNSEQYLGLTEGH